MNITSERLKELEKAERKLTALENGGVDNWDGYDFSMESIRKEDEQEEFIDDIAEEILSILATERYEPSERGAGWAVTEKGMNDLTSYLGTLNIPMKEGE